MRRKNYNSKREDNKEEDQQEDERNVKPNEWLLNEIPNNQMLDKNRSTVDDEC